MANKNLDYYLKLGYKIELTFEPEDGSWMATHPELGRDSCYAIGNTQEEALKRLEDEKKFVLEIALKRGIEIPEPKHEEDILPSGQFVVRLPKTLHKKIKEISEKEGVSLNQFVASVLSEHVGARTATKAFSVFVSDQVSHYSSYPNKTWLYLLNNLIKHNSLSDEKALSKYSFVSEKGLINERKKGTITV